MTRRGKLRKASGKSSGKTSGKTSGRLPPKRPPQAPATSDAAAPPAPPRQPDDAPAADSLANDGITTSNLSLHELFEQQAGAMLERADIDEEQRQNILIAMSCPCCATGGMSISMKMKRRT